ncbi:MAG: penicillin acylase family protein [Nocardioides sp.]
MTPPDATTTETSSPTDDLGWVETFRLLPKPLRVTSYVALGVIGALVVSMLALLVTMRQPLPQTGGELDLPGLESPVTVVRDDHGIPQLYGDSVADLMRAQGFVHAQERFFEMDVRRHITSGRLSELFGEDTVETDAFLRTLGWGEVAEREVALLDPDTRSAFEAYADGVNAYLGERSAGDLGLEYTVLRAGGLDYQPEPWTTVDSLAWLKAMAWDLRGNMTDEIDRVLALSENSPERVAELYPAYDGQRFAPIVGDGGVVDGVFDQDAPGGTRLPQRPSYLASEDAVGSLSRLREGLTRLPELMGRGDGIGSNSWVVDGEHSSTGQPLLANDPHLGVTMPGIWMQMGMHCRTVSADCPLDVAGFTFSGMPGVVIGHNADIAWGFTNLSPDVSDLYLEKVDGDDWIHDGERRPLKLREERIEVLDGDVVTITVRSTAHGPLLSDVSDEYPEVGEYSEVGSLAEPDHRGRRERDYAVSLAWTALEPAPTADAIMALNLAGDWDEFRDAAAAFAVPSQNLVYADREGHIGYQAPGRVPIRQSGNDGYLPAEGWRPDDDWTGEYVPFEGLPHVLDPEEGFIVTANQQVIDDADYPYFLSDDWDPGYRSQRIRDLLEEEGELSVGEMAQLQLDDRHPMAPALVPHLLEQELPGGYDSDGQRLLADWDFTQPADSAAAAYYNVVWRNLLSLTFHDELPSAAWPTGGGRWMLAVEGLLKQPGNRWWDDTVTEDQVETRDDILTAAMLDAREELTRIEARNPDNWDWGHLHQLDLVHQTLGASGIGPLEWLFNRGDWEVGGGGSLVDATSWDASEGYTVTAAPSMRMVVSLADFDESRWISLTGVSGHPASDHYTDQTDLWAEGETLPWAFSRDAVEAAGDDVLTLLPASSE